MIRAATASLAFLILLSGCAMSPRFTEYPQDCNRGYWEGEFNGDVLSHAKALGRTFEKALPYLCVENPETVQLPSVLELLKLPPAEQRPVVAVYAFGDKTGQRKPKDNIADFSTAVTQGNVELIIDALKTAGNGKWFRVVERNGLDHLVRERQIIRSARQDFAKREGQEKFQELDSLLFAGMIIEGGVIGYDTNIKSGGRGARYLGIGATKQYRQDVVTVSMRAVSVLTGEVLLNVQTRKTVLSYGKSGDIFRFIEQGTELVEYEDGIGNNESVTYAVRSAIEQGVLELIYQGHRRDFWKIEGYNENEETN